MSGCGILCRLRTFVGFSSVFDFVIGFTGRILAGIRLGIRLEMVGSGFLRRSRTFVGFLSVFDFAISLLD